MASAGLRELINQALVKGAHQSSFGHGIEPRRARDRNQSSVGHGIEPRQVRSRKSYIHTYILVSKVSAAQK